MFVFLLQNTTALCLWWRKEIKKIKMQKEITPLETIEQQALAHYLRANGYVFYKSPSETFTKSWSQKRKNKLEWVTKWYPDITIILKRWSLLFIELKRKKKSLSRVSNEQKFWISELNNINNVQAEVCYWAEEAIRLIEELERF